MKRPFLKLLIALFVAITTWIVTVKGLSLQWHILLAQRWSFWIIAFFTLCFGYFLFKDVDWKINVLKFLRYHQLGVLCILFSGISLQVHESDALRILADESSISGVAMNLHFHKRAIVPTVVHRVDSRNLVASGFVDKRVVGFPFLLSLIHSITGFRFENVFYLNGALAFVFLSLLYGLVSHTTSRVYGCLTVLFMASFPLFAQNANGGGYEILNLCFILVLALAGAKYLKGNGTEGLDLMVVTAILLSNIRYESVLYLMVPATLFLLKSYRTKSFNLTWFSAISPLSICLPLSFNQIFKSNPAFSDGVGEGFLSFEHFIPNLSGAFYYLFDFKGEYSNSILISFFGVISLAFSALYFSKNAKEIIKTESFVTSYYTILVMIFGITFVALNLHWGDWTDPNTSRFSLPLHLAFVLTIPVVLFHGFSLKQATWKVLLVPCLYLVFFGGTMSAKTIYRVQLGSSAEETWLQNYVQKNLDPNRVMVVSCDSTTTVLVGYPSSSIVHFNKNMRQFQKLKELGLYDEIYIGQRIKVDLINEAEEDSTVTPLNEACICEAVAELPTRYNYVYRLSKFVGIDEAYDFENDVAMPAVPQTDENFSEEMAYYVETLMFGDSWNREINTADGEVL